MSEFDPKLELQRIVFDFEDEEVMVKCLKNHQNINIGGETLKIVKGMEFKTAFWVARILAEEGLVEIENMKSFDIPFMQSLLWDESESQTPIEIDPDFYPVVSLQIENLDKKGTTFSLRDKERMEALLKDIITKRRFKIIKLAQKVGNPSPYVKYLTPEELWLFKALRDQLQQWENNLIECNKSNPCF
ncbi:MAG: hypothetical protein U9O98_04380 [Asgard group archaeon]|nr:hypothetical protein [Asgard group archaeon]